MQLKVQFLCWLLLPALYLVHVSTVRAHTVSKNGRKLPLVINTWDFREANAAAWSVLNHRPGGNALDALVEGCSTCERLQCDHTVGFGGSPDERGETTLDAMVMDGANMNVGAVAGLRRIKDAARVARFVLQHTRHSLLAGDSATDFAVSMGFPMESLVTPHSATVWKKWRERNCQPNFWVDMYPDPSEKCGPYKPLSPNRANRDLRYRYDIGPLNHDTIGMIAIDVAGHIYAGTSSNGAHYKIPGRVGDSPIAGAGAYADNEVGAAVATGDGDVMMRFLPSLLAVEALRSGRTPAAAAHNAIQRIARHYPDFSGALVVVDRFGNYSAACVGMEQFPYSVASGEVTQQTRVEYKVCDETVDFY